MEAVRKTSSTEASSRREIKEIAILQHLQRLDPDAGNIVKRSGVLVHREHICLSFELLDPSLGAYREDRQWQGIPPRELRPITHQLAPALTHPKSIGIIRADVKPDNVMDVVRLQNPGSELIDFGGAHVAFAADPEHRVQELCYESPEVSGGG